MHVFIMPATRHQRTDTPDAARQRDPMVRLRGKVPRSMAVRIAGSPRGEPLSADIGLQQALELFNFLDRSSPQDPRAGPFTWAFVMRGAGC